MKFGIGLHPERGADAVLEEARQADELGYDSVWLYDHFMNWAGVQTPEFPFECMTLGAAILAVTRRTRLSWGTLNLGARNPAFLAKELATIDQLSHGRVIATVGSGWFQGEAEAYNLPWIEDHDDRAAAGYEAIKLMKQLWSHPAPEEITFEGRYHRVKGLAFQPAPYTPGGPPIWVGGASEVTLRTVRDLSDGWVLLGSTSLDAMHQITTADTWPKRPMAVVRGTRILTGETKDEAMAAARRTYEINRRHREEEIELPGHPLPPLISFDEFVAKEIVGTPDECMARIAELEAAGFNYIRVNFDDLSHMPVVARLLLPRYADAASRSERAAAVPA